MGDECFICKDSSLEDLISCSKKCKAGYKVHVSCRDQWHETHRKSLDCPCGSAPPGADFGSYLGKRGSLDKKSLYTALLITFIKFPWECATYPTRLTLFCVVSFWVIHLFSYSTALLLFGFPSLLLALTWMLIFLMRRPAVSNWCETIIARLSPLSQRSNIEHLLYTLYTSRSISDPEVHNSSNALIVEVMPILSQNE